MEEKGGAALFENSQKRKFWRIFDAQKELRESFQVSALGRGVRNAGGRARGLEQELARNFNEGRRWTEEGILITGGVYVLGNEGCQVTGVEFD